MNEGNVCASCGKELITAEEIHVVKGEHYCSKECAITHIMNDIVLNSKELAIAQYYEYAEVVTPSDIGLCYKKVWTSYSKDTDVTTIFLSKCLDKECTEVKSVEVVGFYFGEPDEVSTETYLGELIATY